MNHSADDDPTIIFLHILKTAGTTIISLLEQLYPPERCYATYPIGRAQDGNLEGFDELTHEQKGQIDLLYGHMGFGLHEGLPRPARYFTFLRDPVERVISEYYHAARHADGPFYEDIQAGKMSLKAYVELYAAVETDNLQTRMVAGNWKLRGFGPCNEQMLTKAKQNLKEHFAVVGITERFDESLFLLCHAFGWPIESYTKWQVGNNKPKPREIPEETLRFIAQNNQYDQALYEYGKALFNQQLQSLDRQAKRQLRIFWFRQQMNKIAALRHWSLRVWLRNQFNLAEKQ